MSEAAPLQFLRPRWPVAARVRAAVSLRVGGVSRAPFDGLNLASHVGDEPQAVAANRARLRDALGLPAEPLWLNQVHGASLWDADRTVRGPAPGPAPAVPEADAAVTRTAGRVLAVLVADCLPVLFATRDAAAVGIAHAGWRGLAAGVLETAVAALAVPPAELHAWLGPAIGPQHFEVGDEVYAALGTEASARQAFTPNARDRWQCDLHRLARLRLQRLGVSSLHGESHCTFADEQGCYSYRRDRATGRMAALIWLEPGSVGHS